MLAIIVITIIKFFNPLPMTKIALTFPLACPNYIWAFSWLRAPDLPFPIAFTLEN